MAKQTKAPINAETLNAFARVGFAGEVAFGKEIELIKANAVKGKLAPAYSLAYCAGVVCAKAGLANTKANRELVVKERATRKDDWAAARNRLSRRVKAAGVQPGNASGRKRGTKVAPPKATAEAPAAGEGTMPKSVTPAVPTLVNAAEVMAYLESKVAQMRAAQKKNAKHFTLKQAAALDAFAEAIKAE
jgi:hypothetical protein